MEVQHRGLIEQTSIPRQENEPAARISQAFAEVRRKEEEMLVPYFMCGYPSAEASIEIILAAAAGGANLIELGLPFSDPLADGPAIQRAGQAALAQGMNMQGCMEVARRVAQKSSVPLLFMGYYNPIMAYGIERFCEDAARNGVCGLIVPDLPLEEADQIQETAQRHGLAYIFLVPPTAPDERIAKIAEKAAQGAGNFIYCVSLSGVTGSRTTLPPHLRGFIERVRRQTQAKQVPLAVGFGLSTPEHIAEVTSYADAAVVGSALVNLIERSAEGSQASEVKRYIQSLKRA